VAVLANAVIFVAKAVGGLVSGSVALLAEAAHSLADTVNQVLLFVSISLAERRPDEQHQFGYGRERFFWALLAALFIFVGGAIFSMGEGVFSLVRHEGHVEYRVAYIVLGIAIAAESASFARAAAQLRRQARAEQVGVLEMMHRSTDPTLTTVLLEDSAAIIGSIVAFVAVGLHQLTGDAAWDAAGAVVVGGLLAVVAYLLGRNAKRLLLGEAAHPEERVALRDAVLRHAEVEDVVDVLTSHIGPHQLVVSIRVRLRDDFTATDVARLADTVDEELRCVVPDVDQVFLDPTARE
jgi:cation diffusion facilitator family transporter